MPMLLAALASFLLALARGARPSALAHLGLRWPWLALVALAAQLLALVSPLAPHLPASIGPLVHTSTLALLLAFLLRNLRYRALGLVAVGIALNLAVIAANGGYMPVRPEDARAAGFAALAADLEARGSREKWTLPTADTRLPFLADVILLRWPPGLRRVVSAGDLLIGLGVFLFLQEALLPRSRGRSCVAGPGPCRLARHGASLRQAVIVAATQDPALRPSHPHVTGNEPAPAPPGTSQPAREERLQRLRERFDHFQCIFVDARKGGDWELATNARGNMTLIARELRRLGAEVPTGPGTENLL